MVVVANESPWIVNSKSLMVYKWDPSVGMNKTKLTKVSIWVKLSEVPMEAWTTEGLSAISSSVGRPMIMDSMTTYVCKNRVGRIEYARLIVKIDDVNGFKEVVELQYRDKQQNVKGTKPIKVAYDWKPPLCVVKLDNNKDSGFVQKVRKPPLHTNLGRQGPNRNKENNFEEEFPALSTKKTHVVLSNKEGKQIKDNNSFFVLRDFEDDNIQGINMLKDKIIEADRENEENDRLNGMEGIIEDVLDDEA
ncbi:ATPase, F1/V1/A1 complex, alpha/beta subunit [Tanacetum coccineum]